MNNTGATVHITKLAAAQRQLRAAIRLYFVDEDELAIHTVASAAYRLINDLKAARGMSEAADAHLVSIFYVVRDFRRETLPKHISENSEMMKWVVEMAEKLPITAESKIEDVTAHIDDDAARAFWRKRNEASNFLKHADKDSQGQISLEKVDNFTLLMQAMGAYTDLVKNDLGPEGLVLWFYSSVLHGESESLPEEFRSIGRRLLEVHGSDRRDLCFALIQELRERDAE
jgi:hypothetical protein